MKRNFQVLLTAAAFTLALPILGQETSSKQKMLGRQDAVLLTVTGTIEDIDYTNREVTLKAPSGKVETISVDKSVKRFDEAKVGDQVSLDYYLGFNAELRPPTAEEEANPLVILGADGKAGKESAPAAGSLRAIRAVVTIEGLDRPTRTITVKGPRGKYFVARVADPSRLEQARIGDKIVLTFTEAAAVSLQKVKKHAE
ncbi:MAG TPA: hypothetical protein VLT36_13840 [Candidatus Dormibacteraeota bacterium]|nr:hypothetical protein [Candidatus Dormibacteraeota bacterium]